MTAAICTFAIGDIHGCYRTVRKLFDELPFDAGRDRLWLTGDLVNRGPRSLDVLRWARDLSARLGERLVCVLGNHDLHLLALAAGVGREHHRAGLDQVLAAEDADELLSWLGARPLLFRQQDWLLVHAGLLPQWTADTASDHARRAEARLGESGRLEDLLTASESDPESQALKVMTRIRTCTADGQLCEFTGPPEEAPSGCLPWFATPGRQSRDVTVIAGHWAALGLRLEDDFIGLDSGCVYGGHLSAVRLEDRQVFTVRNQE